MMKNPIIEIKNLTVGYEKNCVINNLNALIYPGEIIGIIGCIGNYQYDETGFSRNSSIARIYRKDAARDD